MEQQVYYHGSPISHLSILRQGSYITAFPEIAYVMGMNYDGVCWSDDNLEEPYIMTPGSMPKFKSWPCGVVHIYQVHLCDEDIELMDNPYEHKTKRPAWTST